ncbi:hypothetical protein ACN42_g7747 [Penicillium freii]|uniref:Uncharacterized protein n=1 Tax=Penicillium freii TaxID=48697 RepID=A0A101MF24_PENFR|nr:hypothetical protein ACN42_g7747 [Penicillium freii]
MFGEILKYIHNLSGGNVMKKSSRVLRTMDFSLSCHVTHYIYRSLVYLSITLRYSGLFGLVCNSPVQGQVVTPRGSIIAFMLSISAFI